MEFITEIASTHNGSLKTVRYLSDEHLKSSSEFLKFQIFKTNNLYSKKDAEYKKYKNIEISFSDWKKIILYYSKKTKLILEPFDYKSFLFCKKFKKKTYLKVSSSETDNIFLIKKALKDYKKVFINLSGFSFDKIKIIISKFNNHHDRKKLVIMYGFQSYPTKVINLRFNIFNFFKNKNFEYGYADHSRFGITKELIQTSFLAIKKKCKYIEKHVCKNIRDKPHDYISALEFADFRKYLKLVRNKNFINHDFKIKFNKRNSYLTSAEQKYSKTFHKVAYTKEKININQILDNKKITFLRKSTINGISRFDFNQYKLKAKVTIKKNQFLDKKNIKILKK